MAQQCIGSTAPSYHTQVYLGETGPQVEKFSLGSFIKYLGVSVAVMGGIVGLMHGPVAAETATTSLMAAPNAVPTVAPAVARSASAMVPPAPQQHVEHHEVEVMAPSTEGPAMNPLSTVALTTAAVNFMTVDEATAGTIFQGRTASMLHPASMFAMFVLSCYAAWQGFQWRRTRTIGADITAKKAEVTALAAKLTTSLEGSASEALKGEVSAADKTVLQAIVPLEAEVAELQAERKTLTAGNFRDKHFAAGSAILAVGVSSAIVGPVNTYLRVGKLFPGPHLYVGAAMVSGWAIASALVPQMQKGNETARSIHIAINVVNTGFFAWQVLTGWEILVKVWGFTSWP